jgi:hypothetical protein
MIKDIASEYLLIATNYYYIRWIKVLKISLCAPFFDGQVTVTVPLDVTKSYFH